MDEVPAYTMPTSLGVTRGQRRSLAPGTLPNQIKPICVLASKDSSSSGWHMSREGGVFGLGL